METLKIVAKGLPATVEDYQLALNAAFAGGVGFATAKSEQEQSEQEQGEPVGEMQLSAIYEGMVVPVVSVELPVGTKLYTTSQQRTWVGLTDEERAYLTQEAHKNGLAPIEFIEAVETKLKEKNI